MPRSKFYAVRRGREGPKIYDDWTEVRFVGAKIEFT